MHPPRLLFVCTGNSCRSHIAEGLARAMGGGRVEVCSAGSHPAGYVHPVALAVMDEIGIDLRGHSSKGLADLPAGGFDYVITVCDHAAAHCPTLRGRRATLHWPTPDPTWEESEAERLDAGRRVREELRVRIAALLAQLAGPPAGA
jgi:arsenate reductase